MTKTEATVMLHCTVHDEQALYVAAKERLIADHHRPPLRQYITELLGTKRHPKVGNCLQMLLDPGSSPVPAAFVIEESEAREDFPW